MKTRFYYCKQCGNIVVKLVDSGVVPFCCGEEMTELKANIVENVSEKHLPVVKIKDVCEQSAGCRICVKIGEETHPMDDNHYIRFIAIETEDGGQINYLDPGKPPKAEFYSTSPVKAIYAYCNVHGLWKVECKQAMTCTR